MWGLALSILVATTVAVLPVTAQRAPSPAEITDYSGLLAAAASGQASLVRFC